MKRAIFFCSPIGLGHVTRDVAIHQHFQDISTKFVTGNAATKFLQQLQYNVQDAYIPPHFIVKNGLLQNPSRWLWEYYKYYIDCKKISSNIIQNENSDVVISDEDFASITIAQKQKIPTVLITDILKTRFTKGFVSIIEKKMNQSMKNIMKKCDVVILPEEGDDKDNIKRVGPIVRTINNSRDELRKRFLFNKKTIVVSIGGTNAGEFLLEKILKTKIKSENTELVIVSGPSLKKDFGKNIRNFGFVNNLHEIIFAADLIISLAGKSTIDESKSYGTPGIFIPIKNHFEQEDNAKVEGFSYNDINRLESLISQKLEEGRNPQNYEGAKKSAEIIKNICSD